MKQEEKKLSKYEQIIKDITIDELFDWEMEGIFPPSVNRDEYEKAKQEYFKLDDDWFENFLSGLTR